MAKKNKRVRGIQPVSEVMGDWGFKPIEKAPNGKPTGGAVHAPQLMALSNQITPPRRGTRELLKLYSESPWLRAIVSKIARSVAETDWVLCAKKNNTGRYIQANDIFQRSGALREKMLTRYIEEGSVDIIYEHPILDFLANGTGNPRLKGFAALEVTQKHYDLTGEAFWLIEPNEIGLPYAFWPLPPSWITSFPNETIPYYEVNVPGGVQVKIPTTMIVPFIDPDPENPYLRGTGISKALDDEIQIDEYAAKHQKAFFLNRARPDIIISGQFINQKDAERLEKQWLSSHQGFWKAFKPLFFSQKIDVKELSQTFESMQMVQVRKHERDTFVSVFGAPPEKFGIIGESKRSTINAADYFWNKDLIKPRVEIIRRMVQDLIVPQFDERIILYYDTPVIQDEEFQLEAMRQAPYAPTINEWRKVQGFASLGPAGDVLVVPLNSQLIPTKTENGEPLSSPEEVAEESIRQRVAAGPVNMVEFESKNIASEIARELVDVIESSFKKLGKQAV